MTFNTMLSDPTEKFMKRRLGSDFKETVRIQFFHHFVLGTVVITVKSFLCK